jgi:hypothetical protein
MLNIKRISYSISKESLSEITVFRERQLPGMSGTYDPELQKMDFRVRTALGKTGLPALDVRMPDQL